MNKGAMVVVLAIVAAALGAGYWLGSRGGHEAAEPQAAAKDAKQERRLLFYRNPMGLPDTSPVPKKDPMGMDYIPVYEGEESAEAGSGIVVSTEKVQKLGVRTEIAALRELSRSVRASGRIEVDERRLHTVSPKFEGWIEKLHVNATGQPVGRGQPLAEGRRWHLLAQLSDESAPAAVEHDLPGHIAYRSHPAAGRLPAWSVLVSIESP